MKKFFKIVLWVVIAIVFIGTFVFLFLNSKPKVTTYALVSPTDTSIERTTVLTGKIEPRDEIDIKPQISGIISEINVEPGDMVHVKRRDSPHQGDTRSIIAQLRPVESGERQDSS